MIFAIFPIVLLLVGLFAWALATRPMLKDMGKIAFAVGLFFATQAAAHVTLHLP